MKIGLYNENGLDRLSQLENNSIDFILTDPPYIISRDSGMNDIYQNGSTSEKYGNKYAIKTDYGKWDSEFTIEELKQFIEEYYRVLKSGGSCIIFFDLWKLETIHNLMDEVGFNKLRFIEWIKTNPVPINSHISYLSNSREIAIFGGKGTGQVFNSKYDNGIYEYPIYQGVRGVDRIHDTQKSLDLFIDLIQKHTNENDVILDTFSGSATTYLASKITNRQCISTEIDTEMYNKSKKRIEYHKDRNFSYKDVTTKSSEKILDKFT